MALYASTTVDIVRYVARRDPARGDHKPVWVDPKDQTKGEILSEADVERFAANGATVFHLRPLDVFLMGWIYDRASVLRGARGSDEIDIHTKTNQTNIDAVRFGLAGWDNFQIRGGGAVVFQDEEQHVNGRDYRVATGHMLSALRDITLIQELADRVKKISEVSGDEEKNSGSPLSLPG